MNEIVTKAKTLDIFPKVPKETTERLKQIANDTFGQRIKKKRLEIERVNEALISSRLASLRAVL